MAIKVTISTLEAVREELPAFLKGLDEETLQNIQSIADPVPPHLSGIEYWPEVDDTPAFDSRTHTKGLETLTADAGTKTVSSVYALDELSLDDVIAHCEKEVRAKMNQVLTSDIDVGGGIISNRAELQENRDLLDGTGPSEVNFNSGHRTLTVPQQNTIKNNLKSHHRGSHKRAHDILELIMAETTGTDKVAVLDTELPLGWPS